MWKVAVLGRVYMCTLCSWQATWLKLTNPLVHCEPCPVKHLRRAKGKKKGFRFIQSDIMLKLIPPLHNYYPADLWKWPHSYIFDILRQSTRAHCKVTFPLSYPLLLGGQRHSWRSEFSDNCRCPMNSCKLAQCRDLNPWSSDHKNYALANCTTDLQCTTRTEYVMSMTQGRLVLLRSPD